MNTTTDTPRPRDNGAKTQTPAKELSLTGRITQFGDQLQMKAALGRMEFDDELRKLRAVMESFEEEASGAAEDVRGRSTLAMKRARERFTELETKLLS